MSNKRDDSLVMCDCGGDVKWGKCGACGWRSAERKLRDASARKGAWMWSKRAPRDEKLNACPLCGGKGWKGHAVTGTCSGCSGRGTVTAFRRAVLLR